MDAWRDEFRDALRDMAQVAAPLSDRLVAAFDRLVAAFDRGQARRRAELTVQLSRIVRCGGVLASLGSKRSNIVAVLPEDTMDFVWSRVRDGFDGAPTVLGMQDDDGVWHLSTLRPLSSQ